MLQLLSRGRWLNFLTECSKNSLKNILGFIIRVKVGLVKAGVRHAGTDSRVEPGNEGCLLGQFYAAL